MNTKNLRDNSPARLGSVIQGYSILLQCHKENFQLSEAASLLNPDTPWVYYYSREDLNKMKWPYGNL